MLSKKRRSMIGVLALGSVLALPAFGRPASLEVAEWRQLLAALGRFSFYELVVKTIQILAPGDQDEEGGYVDPDGKA